MKNRVQTIAAACYHKYSQHFVDLERFYEIAKDDGKIEAHKDIALLLHGMNESDLSPKQLAEIISSKITK